MTPQQTNLLYRTLGLGVAITFLVMALDFSGALKSFEDPLYDFRARHAQQFAPVPTDKLVHLDIDDASLESVGRWPWPRSVRAEILDELGRAGAKVVAFDIIDPDPQDPTVVVDPADPTRVKETIDHDARLAQSIRAFGRVLIPVSFVFQRSTFESPENKAIGTAVRENLRTSWEALRPKLEKEFPRLRASGDTLLAVRREIIANRVEQQMFAHPGTLAEITERLIPGATAANTEPELFKEIEVEYRAYQSKQEIARFGRTPDRPLANILTPAGENLMIPPLAKAAAYTGFVDHLPYGDGVERSVPLWVLYRGRLYPQMGLSLACATLGVPMEAVRVTDDRVVIPRPDGKVTVIPTHSFESAGLGRTVSGLMDVPWFGSSSWQTMYDYPNYTSPKQHLPVGVVWRMAQARKQGARNNTKADDYLYELLKILNRQSEIRAFLEHVPDVNVLDSRFTIVRWALGRIESDLEAAGGIDELRKLKPDELAAADPSLPRIIKAYDGLQLLLRENQSILDKQVELRDKLAGKSILVGSIATGAFDFVTTPLFPQCPGVVVHGAIFNAIMLDYVWHRFPWWSTAVVTLGIGMLATLAVATLTPKRALVATAVLIFGYATINGYVIFGYYHWILGLAGPVIAAGLVWSFITLMRLFTEMAARKRITDRFRSYADSKLVDYVLKSDKDVFAGQERELSCVFTDMQGFTSLMEKLGSGIVPALNEYMGRMTPLISDNGGYLNKFLGDGIMFFYNGLDPDPDHASHAVRTVLEMQQTAIPAFNDWLRQQGLDVQVAVRAGITTGHMIVGDAGSTRRADYTVLGDAVNLSARLESANKYVGTKSMITERTAQLCKGEFLLRPVARIQVVGKTESVTAFEPMAYAARATDEQKRLADATTAIFDAFIAGDFSLCLERVEQAEREFGPSKLFSLYARNCDEHMRVMPVDFDGRIVLAEK